MFSGQKCQKNAFGIQCRTRCVRPTDGLGRAVCRIICRKEFLRNYFCCLSATLSKSRPYTRKSIDVGFEFGGVNIILLSVDTRHAGHVVRSSAVYKTYIFKHFGEERREIIKTIYEIKHVPKRVLVYNIFIF